MRDVSIWSREVCALGEGPLTHHLRNSLVWCDINSRRIYERFFDSGATMTFELPVMPSAMGIIDKQSVLVATETDFRFLDLDTGEHRVHVKFPVDETLRSNDGRVHPSGAFWIGTMAKDGRSKPGAIWSLLNGELTLLMRGVQIPNSICFAEDGSFAYYTDTPERTIWRIPTEPKSGEIVGEKEPFVVFGEDFQGGPDGSIVDAQGNLWNARWGGSAVDVYSNSGERIDTYELPVLQPTCPSFVGENLDRVVTTTAAVGLKTPTKFDGTVLEIASGIQGRKEPIARP